MVPSIGSTTQQSLARPSPALLPEKTVLRKGFGQVGPDQRLDLAVGDADEVLRPLGLTCQDFATCEISGCEVSSLADQLGGHSEAGFDRDDCETASRKFCNRLGALVRSVS